MNAAITVCLILAGILVPSYAQAGPQSGAQAVENTIKSLEQAAKGYRKGGPKQSLCFWTGMVSGRTMTWIQDNELTDRPGEAGDTALQALQLAHDISGFCGVALPGHSLAEGDIDGLRNALQSLTKKIAKLQTGK